METTFHRDGTVTLWNVYTQQWWRTRRPSDRVLASLDRHDRERIIKHCNTNGEDMDQNITLKLVVASGLATRIGEVYGAYDGVSWRDAVDSCDGTGRVFLECDDQDTVDFVEIELELDDRVVEWSVE